MFAGTPLIAVTSASNHVASEGREPRELRLGSSYVPAVAVAGAAPVIACEETPELFAGLCDGLLMTGGPDVSPSRYGEAPLNSSVKTDPARDLYEEKLLRAFLKEEKPIFGICRGCQFLNVAFGGSLHQDLPPEDGWDHRDRAVRHKIIALEDSIVGRLFGTEFQVNTIHHQSVKQLGRGLRVTARSPGGIIEAYEHEDLPVFAVQFHPEKLANDFCDNTTQDFQPLFDYFVRLVRRSAEARLR